MLHVVICKLLESPKSPKFLEEKEKKPKPELIGMIGLKKDKPPFAHNRYAEFGIMLLQKA
jgi:hypothetical protein